MFWLKHSYRWAVMTLITILLIVSCQQSVPLAIAPTVIKLSGWSASPAEQRLLNQVLQNFEATHPTIKVKFEVIADQFMDVLKTRLIGDAAADVFYLDSVEAPFLMKQGVLEPLDPYITPDVEIADFEPNLLQTFTDQNHIYGLPKDYSTLALFYNRTAFAAAGLTQPPYTWAQFLNHAQRLTRDRDGDGKIDQYGFGVMPELARQAHSIQALGGEIVDANGFATFANDAGLRGMALAVQQYRSDKTSARPLDVGTNNGSEMFGQGKAAMVLEGNWAIPFLQETFADLDFAIAEAPQINGKPATMVYTVAYVMNHQSTHKQAAWELIAYLTGKEGMGLWTSKGLALPSRQSVAKALKFANDPLRQALVAGVNYATPWQIGQYPAAIVNSFNNQYVSAALGEKPLKEAMVQAQESANRQIKAAL